MAAGGKKNIRCQKDPAKAGTLSQKERFKTKKWTMFGGHLRKRRRRRTGRKGKNRRKEEEETEEERKEKGGQRKDSLEW